MTIDQNPRLRGGVPANGRKVELQIINGSRDDSQADNHGKIGIVMATAADSREYLTTTD
jgi:hypothetical protein